MLHSVIALAAELTGPIEIGKNHPGGCNTVLQAADTNEDMLATKGPMIALGGVTASTTGPHVTFSTSNTCFATMVPFVYFIEPLDLSSLTDNYLLFSGTTSTPSGQDPIATEVTALKWFDTRTIPSKKTSSFAGAVLRT